MKKYRRYSVHILMLLSVSLLCACGQKDDLYLPDKQALAHVQETV